MNSKQISTVNMQRRVLNFLKRYLTVLAKLPLFNSWLKKYEDNLTLINNLGNQQETDIRGLRTQKDDMKLSTGIKALDISNRIEAFAKNTGNVVLAQKIHYTDTDLLKRSNHDFMVGITIIYEIAEENKEALVEYEVTAETLADLKTSIDSYKNIMDAPKEGYTGKKQATNQLNDALDQQAIVLDKIDGLIEMLRFSNAPLYTEYQDTRKIVYRSGSLTVKCDVLDAATNLPLVGATVNFSKDGEVVFEKVTSTAGGLMIKSMNDGTYTVTVSRLGYVTQSLTVNVMNVEMTSVKVALESVRTAP